MIENFERVILEFFVFDNTRMLITENNIKFYKEGGNGYIELSTMLLMYEETGKIQDFLIGLMAIWDTYEDFIDGLPVADVIHDIL